MITGVSLASDVISIPASISVVNSESIDKMPSTKLTDIVKKLAGVRVDNDVGFNPRPKIRIRGLNNGTLLMLDNVILSDLDGENRILNSLILYDVERVEVARGGYSSLYGTGAIGGVINFITAMPDSFELKTYAGYGNEFARGTADKNLFKAYVSIGDALFDKKLKLKFSAGYSSTDGYSSFPAILPKSESNIQNINGIVTDKAGNRIIGTGGDRVFQTYDIALKASYELNENNELSGSVRFSSYDYTFKNFQSFLRDNQGNPISLVNNKDYFVGSGYGGIGRYSHIIGNVALLHSFGDASLNVSLSSVNLLSQWQDAQQGIGNQFGGAGTTQDIDTSSNFLDIIYENEYLDNHKFSIGTQFRYYTLTQHQRNMTNWRVSSTRTDSFLHFGSQALVSSVYANVDSVWVDSINFGKFSSSAGVRFDYWQNFGGFFHNYRNNEHQDGIANSVFVPSPKLALAYIPFDNSHSLKLSTSIGSGFRMPTMREFYQFTHGESIWEINHNLKYERALNFEIGAEYVASYLSTSLYYYQIEMFDMIYRSGSGKQDDPFKNINAGRARINGLEYMLSLPLIQNLVLDASYTLTLAKILSNTTRPQSVGKPLAQIPKHMTNLSLSYLPKSGFYASIWAYYAPSFSNDDIGTSPLSNTFGYYENQFSLNSKLGFAFESGFDMNLSFFNITNNRYYDFYRVAGASFYTQISYRY